MPSPPPSGPRRGRCRGGSVDLRIQAGGPRRPALDLQRKATTGFGEPQAGGLSFRLPMKNYNDLRIFTQTPRLLVVLELPQDESQWMTVTSRNWFCGVAPTG